MRIQLFVMCLFVLCSIAKASECSHLFSAQSVDTKTQIVIAKTLTITHTDFIKHFSGRMGYLYISEKYYESNMFKAYTDVLKILGQEKFKELAWPLFKGTAAEYRSIGNMLMDQNQSKLSSSPVLNKAFVGMLGEMRFATKYYEEDIHAAYIDAYTVLDPELFLALGWKDFLGTVTEMMKHRKMMMDLRTEQVFKKYIGFSGLSYLARTQFFGDRLLAWTKITAVLNDAEVKQLKWQGLDRSLFMAPSNTTKIKERISKQVFPSSMAYYAGQEGYARLADDFFDGDMGMTYHRMIKILGFRQVKQLQWKKFRGQTTQFEQLRMLVLNEKGQVHKKYIGKKGYAIYAYEYFEGDMDTAYVEMTKVINAEEMQQLNWTRFYGSVWDFMRQHPHIKL